MIVFLLPAAVLVLLLAIWFFSVAAYSLRNFSYNKIDEVCQARNVAHRYGEILQHHSQTLLASEFLSFAVVAALLLITAVKADTWSMYSPDPLGISAFIGQLFGLSCSLIVWVVMIPRTWARVGGESFVVRFWPLLSWARRLTTPILRSTGKLDQIAHRLAGVSDTESGTLPTLTQEILSVVDEGQREGILEPQARTMIHRVMELQREDVASIMTPRTEMHVLQQDTPLDQARQILLEGGHSRVPVVGNTTDDIVGILYAKDLLQHVDGTNGHAVALKDIVREAIYVPETTGIDKLLERMKREHVHIAIVIDEYSGVSGLVTLEDILEEIVGEITDEYDPEEEEEIHKISDDVIEVDARVHVDELNDQFEFELPEDGDFETIGGFVFNQLGRVPKKSESFTWRNLTITVVNVGKRKIHKIRIEIDRSFIPAAAEEV